MPRPDLLQLLDRQIKEHKLFEKPGLPIHIATAPARLDVLGGPGAQVGSALAQMTLPNRAAVAVQLHENKNLIIHQDTQLPTAPLTALWHILSRDLSSQSLAGATLIACSDIPTGAAQASTTALLTAAAVAIVRARHLDLPPSQLVSYIQQAQEIINPWAGGAAIDATTCLLAPAPNPRQASLLRYSTQPCELIGSIPLPDNIRILALDTGVRNPHASNILRDLHVAGAMGLAIIETIYRDLGQRHTPLHGYLANTSPLLYRQYFRALLPKRLRGNDFLRTYGSLKPPLDAAFDPAGIYRVRTAVDHFIAEHEHAEQFLQAIEELSEKSPENQLVMRDPEERQRTLQRAGRLALASHHSYRLRLELSCFEADWLVDHLMEAGPDRGIFGARITGPGGGGTVMALADRSPAASDAILETIGAYQGITGKRLTVLEAGGAGSGGALNVSSSHV
jgi:L-arabinokinase